MPDNPFFSCRIPDIRPDNLALPDIRPNPSFDDYDWLNSFIMVQILICRLAKYPQIILNPLKAAQGAAAVAAIQCVRLYLIAAGL